jgi:hypothetical protein
MPKNNLETYLNDHVAGSVLALDLLEHLEATHNDEYLRAFCRELRADIERDGEQLESLMAKLEIAQSKTRKASAWVAEKVTELKLRIDDPSGGDLRLFESFEMLALGIEGKRLLWLALKTSADKSSVAGLLDYDLLIQRAQEQRDRVEARRIELARKALA